MRVKLSLALLIFAAIPALAAIEHIVIEKPVRMRNASGVALGPHGGAIEGVRVQVFDKPELLFDRKVSWVEAEKLRHKLDEMTTKADGRFHSKLAPGKYEIRLTKNEVLFDPLSYVLVVDKKVQSHAGVCVYMKPEGGAGGVIATCDVAHPPDRDE